MTTLSRGIFRHTVTIITAGAFLISTLIPSLQPMKVSALEGATSGATPPTTPINLAGTATTTPSLKVTLTWQQPTGGEFYVAPTRYVIYRIAGDSPNFSGATPLAYTSDTSTAYEDTSVTYGKYNYKVAGQVVTVDGMGFPQTSESNNSNMATVIVTSTPVETPNPSPTIIASLSSDQRTATVSWTAVSGATGYTAYRKAPGESSFSAFNTYSNATTQFPDTSIVVNSGTYTYKIVAAFASGSDTESNEASVTPRVSTGGGGSVPVPPTLTITATAKSSSQIDVTWPFVTDALYYYVYSDTSPGSMLKVGNGAPGPLQVSFEHKNLLSATTYYYKVEAYNGTGILVVSNIASATTFPSTSTPPTNPTPTTTPTTTTTPTPPVSPPPPPVVSGLDECGANDRLSPVRITDPNSGVKFTQLPGKALFRPGETPVFTYCFRNTQAKQVQVKVRRTLVNNKTLKEYASTIGSVILEPQGHPQKADRFSFNRNQYLEKSLPLGEYRVRVQVIDETQTGVGDEPLPIALNQVDENSFIFVLDSDLPVPPLDPNNPPPLLKPSEPTSDIKFTQMPNQNSYWAGQALKVAFTYKNNSGKDQNLKLVCSLLDDQENLLDQQTANLPRLRARQTVRLNTGKGCVLPGTLPLSLLLPTGYYTFRAELYDKNTDELVDSNSFNFRVVKKN